MVFDEEFDVVVIGGDNVNQGRIARIHADIRITKIRPRHGRVALQPGVAVIVRDEDMAARRGIDRIRVRARGRQAIDDVGHGPAAHQWRADWLP